MNPNFVHYNIILFLKNNSKHLKKEIEKENDHGHMILSHEELPTRHVCNNFWKLKLYTLHTYIQCYEGFTNFCSSQSLNMGNLFKYNVLSINSR